MKEANPSYVKLANSWIILNCGGGPTPDKPEVLLETPRDRNRVSSFLNLRVADIWACYRQRKAKGAEFLTEPVDNHGEERRCYRRDPDGYLIEVGQHTPSAIEDFRRYLAATEAAPKQSWEAFQGVLTRLIQYGYDRLVADEAGRRVVP